MDVVKSAKNYLQDRPLVIKYYERTKDGARELYSEEYPDYIPKKDEYIKMKDIKDAFIVSYTLFSPEDNVIEVLLEDYREHIRKVRREN